MPVTVSVATSRETAWGKDIVVGRGCQACGELPVPTGVRAPQMFSSGQGPGDRAESSGGACLSGYGVMLRFGPLLVWITVDSSLLDFHLAAVL